jgi:hypothetical protein
LRRAQEASAIVTGGSGTNNVEFTATFVRRQVLGKQVFITLNSSQLKVYVCAFIGGGLWEGFPNRRQ